ncbi:MAG: DUF1743 domain-containing protein [Candidatus Methanomethylophilaceae archaeon]|nr:DUF1743 domain-containing protein [Candidatus Methanomethylophilaceae archaeon]
MYVAVDDTDSIHGNCTTFLATEIIRELSDLDLIGYPRLVRLNPATPWKTRGNGSLVMRFGRGRGRTRIAGEIGGSEVRCFDSCTGYEPDYAEVLERLIPIVDRNHEDDADPGLLISRTKPPQHMYFSGVRTILGRPDVEQYVDRPDTLSYTIGNGRGLIGCVCGMAWRPMDRTYELLTYRPRERWGTERSFVPGTIRDVEFGLDSTFNSWEERSRKVAMVPSTPCPVMYGLRGDSADDLLLGRDMIGTEPIDRWMVFLTNQGTDDHIIRHPESLVPNQSYLVGGTVVSTARHILGGHVLMDLETDHGVLTCAAYEPSKEFRYLFDWLVPGDVVEVMGELRDDPRTLNVEKVHVVSLARDVVKVSNPVCPLCTRTMKSTGKGQAFKCKRCGTRSTEPITAEVRRQVVTGWYEPPTSARRHLSKPLKRMGLTQPVEFVNGRI